VTNVSYFLLFRPLLPVLSSPRNSLLLSYVCVGLQSVQTGARSSSATDSTFSKCIAEQPFHPQVRMIVPADSLQPVTSMSPNVHALNSYNPFASRESIVTKAFGVQCASASPSITSLADGPLRTPTSAVGDSVTVVDNNGRGELRLTCQCPEESMPETDVDISGVELDARCLQLSEDEEVSSITCVSSEGCASILSCPWESLLLSSPSLS
jgi:hypothetical protein